MDVKVGPTTMGAHVLLLAARTVFIIYFGLILLSAVREYTGSQRYESVGVNTKFGLAFDRQTGRYLATPSPIPSND